MSTGGSLGKKLFLTVEELSSQNQLPLVKPYSNIKDVIIEISEKRLGVTAVIENDKVLGVITDGDLRRMLAISDNISNITAKEIMSKNPKTITLTWATKVEIEGNSKPALLASWIEQQYL